MTNTILAGNGTNCAGTASTNNAGNLADDSSCGVTQVTTASLSLGSLADNGGPTLTIALGSGSSAIGAAHANCPATDQRGAPRSTPCSSGAFEYGATAPVLDSTPPTASPTQAPAANANGWNSGDVTVTWNWSDNAGGSGIGAGNCTTSSTSSGEGTITLHASCTDRANNTGTATYSVKVDKTAPTASPTQAPAANAYGWHNR